jgi:serine/threonine protein phosphatase PrpC
MQISVRAVKGGRVAMEDEYFVADGGRFVAVFDGHGGGGVSQFLKNHLYESVCHHVQVKHWEENDTIVTRPSSAINATACDSLLESEQVRRPDITLQETPSVFSYAAAFKAAFSEIEEKVLTNETLEYQGSTAVAVLIHEQSEENNSHGTSKRKHRILLSANVGDSRAVLSRNGRAVDLTRDHKPNDDLEKARILAMGETIEWDRVSKVHRVRNLSLSRAIGDKYAKPVVSGEVEINHYPLIDESDEFILLASDGLWDVMTSDEAVIFVHEKIQKEISSVNVAKGDVANFSLVLRRNMAKFVAREAIRRGSSDNVCVVMVWLDDLR